MATPERILLRGYAPKGYTRIVELSPPLTAAASTNAPVLSRLPVHDYFSVEIPRFDQGRDRIYSGFLALNTSGAGSPRPLGQVRYVNFVRDISRVTNALPAAKSKKGLWVDRPADAVALGLQHAALEFDLGKLLCARPVDGCLEYRSEGLVCRFRLAYLKVMDDRIKTLSDAGVLVTLVLLNPPTGDPAIDHVLQPSSLDSLDGPVRNPFNTRTPEGVQHFVACMEFLAGRYAAPKGPNGQVAHYVLGHPVNAAGLATPRAAGSFAASVADYCRTARLAWLAIRKSSANARLFIALDGAWADPAGAGSKRLLEQWHRVTDISGDFGWHVALTPRSDDPFNPRVWEDPSASYDPNAPRISFRNLEVLTRFLRQPEFTPFGRPRQVLILGAGFHTPDGPEGQSLQAAAFCYAYRKAQSLDGINAFILARQDDPPAAAEPRAGMWLRNTEEDPAKPGAPKKIVEVFKAADGAGADPVFRELLAAAGLSAWEAPDWPRTVEEAARRLLLLLGQDDTDELHRASQSNLGALRLRSDPGIRERFGLSKGNEELLKATGKRSAEEASAVIIEAAWQKLQVEPPRKKRWRL